MSEVRSECVLWPWTQPDLKLQKHGNMSKPSSGLIFDHTVNPKIVLFTEKTLWCGSALAHTYNPRTQREEVGEQ